MSKKIVVITGSPRKAGNSFAMTDAFIKAAQAKGHTVTRFDAAMMNVGGCHACETCFKSGKACSFDDDFNKIAPAVLEADDEGGRVGGLHLRRGNNSGQHVSEFLLFLDRGGRLLHAVRTGGSAGGKPPYAKAG